MRKIKLLMYGSVAALFILMTFPMTGESASVIMQRETASQKAQENTVMKSKTNAEESRAKFTPRKLKDKGDPGTESEKSVRSVNYQRYRPPQAGEGESKIK